MSKELIDRLKSYIPSGDWHNSQYANDLADAVAILEAKAAPVGEREAFEAHMRVGGYSNPDKHPDGSYVSSAMELWWQGWKARAAHQRQQAREVVSDAARDVLAERQRQISAEGMTNAGDDGYRAAELPRAAAAYILNGANDEAPAIWPWAKAWWKPRDARANYVRAGALILAEIERLDRLNKQEGGSHD